MIRALRTPPVRGGGTESSSPRIALVDALKLRGISRLVRADARLAAKRPARLFVSAAAPTVAFLIVQRFGAHGAPGLPYLLAITVGLLAAGLSGGLIALLGSVLFLDVTLWLKNDTLPAAAWSAVLFLVAVLIWQSIARLYLALDAARSESDRVLSTIEAVRALLWELDPESGRISVVASNLPLGYTPQSLADRSFRLSRMHPEDAALEPARIEEVLARGRMVYDVRMLDAQDRWRTLASRASRVDGKGEHAHLIRGLTVDVTEQRAVEEHLRQSHRLEAVGQLAGGIAHDFNNLLTVIIGLSGLALTAGEKKSREHLEEIASAGRQASELVARLLAFSRMQAVEPRLVDLNEVVGSSRKLLAQLLGERIDLLTDLEPGPLPIVADPGQLEQIVINLAMNARDAMPGRGGLTIHTERIVDGEPRVSLAIEDTGHGMDERTRERIFDPFFTTKEPGKGTGLGLSIVHGIVEQAGGEISVDSEPGRGTRVTVVMPRAETAPEPLGGPRGEVAAHDEGRRVLLVEDNDPVRRTASLMLADAGFVVVAVADGEQALRLLETGASFDVVVTDQVMPRLLGTELAARIWAREPAMPVLFTSAQLSLGDELSLAGSPARVLWKPYTGPELASAIDGLLRDTASLAPVVSLLGEAEPTA